MKKRKRTFLLNCVWALAGVVVLAALGCGPVVQASAPLPAADAPLDAIWTYAESLQVEAYAARRFGSYPDGLRRATQAHRIDFLSNGTVEGRPADLQCYLFFEYRRWKSLPEGTAVPPETTRYVRALITSLNSWE